MRRGIVELEGSKDLVRLSMKAGGGTGDCLMLIECDI